MNRNPLFLLLLCLSCSSQPSEPATPLTATATQGMVSSAHPLATEAGLEILQAGGNAFDAAVAVAAALNVVEPMMSGAGGYGTILVYDAQGRRTRFLNASAHIPRNTDSDAYRAPTPNFKENRRGAKAVSTPGNVRAWEAMSGEYGALPWEQLFQPAIRLAREGFELREREARFIERAFEDFPAHAQAFYGRDGKPLLAGERLVQQDLARTLETIAKQGAGAFHGGAIGQAIDQAMRDAQGFLSLEDLEASQAEWWEPIRIRYREHDVYTASPPSTAFPSLIRLGLMSRFPADPQGPTSAGHLHRFAEATKHAFWCRLAYAGDPDVNPPPLERLLSEQYWQEQAEAIDPDRARPFEYPGARIEADSEEAASQHTTHFVVADAKGNIVTATQTLGNLFGSRIMAEGTGVWLNNSLAYCTFEPKGNPMDAHAGRRKLSGDCPTLIFRNGRPWVALGTPGGHTIGQTVPQMVMNLIDFQMDLGQALSAPRISFIEPDLIAVEDGIPEEVRQELQKRGHKLRPGVRLGNAHALLIEYDELGRPVKFSGAADPRGEGLAKGR